jgi:uncharacterized protein involved in exopolysaccharide biosynthesis
MEQETQDLKHILNVIRRRRQWLIWPFLAVVTLTAAVALLLPDSYQSSATILIQNQQIPTAMVPSTVTSYAEERIQTITQEVTSRTKILNLVNKYDLLPQKREQLSTEDLVERIRKRINIQPINAEINKEAKGRPTILTIAFSLTYQDEDPRKAQAVAAEIASYYMEKNLESREKLAKGTTEFLEDQLKQTKARIDDLETRRAAFREAHLEELPEFTALNMQKLEKLNSRLNEIQLQIRSLEEQRTTIKGRLAMLDPHAGGTGRTLSPSERLQQAQLEYAQLLSKYSDKHPLVQAKSQELALLEAGVKGGSGATATLQDQVNQLESKLAALQSRYSDAHPEVKTARRELDRVKKELAASQGIRRGSGNPRLDEGTNPAYVSLVSDLDRIGVSVSSLKTEGERVEEQVRELYVKLRATPQVAREYNEMETEYQVARSHYNEIQQKLMAARVSQGMEEEQLGEKFQIVEPPFLPERPSKPNRLAIVLIGIVLGMGFSVGAAALREFTDHTVRDSSTLQAATGVEVLTVIPRIYTPADLARLRRRRLVVGTAMVGSFVGALLAFHFLVMDLDIFLAKLERFIQRRML